MHENSLQPNHEKTQRTSSGNIIVTGASRGIGKSLVKKILANHGRVYAIARNLDGLHKLKEEIRSLRLNEQKLEILACDLTNPESASLMIEKVKSKWKHVDGLVNNAAVIHYEDIGKISLVHLEQQLQVNLISPILLSQQISEIMKSNQTEGSIVNIASTLGIQSAPATSIYSATKAALISITKSFAMELAKHKIRVNAIAPGVVETEMIENHPRVDSLKQLHPLGRLGTPEEIAEAACFVLDASWMTGTILTVDGGLTLQDLSHKQPHSQTQ